MSFNFSPIGLLILLIGAIMILFGPRRYVVGTIFFLVVFISMRNRVLIGSLDFMMHRIVVVLGWMRLLMRKEYAGIEFGRVDKAVICLVLWSFAAYTLLHGTANAFIYRAAVSIDILGLFFLFRALTRSWGDLEFYVKSVGVVCVLLAGAVAFEFLTHRNALTFIGGVPDSVWIRKGKLRCQAAFGHPISAGVFGATLLPVWMALYWIGGKWRKWGIIGIGTSTVITGASASSSTALAYVSGAFAVFMWPLRHHLRKMRWMLAGTLLFLHIIMTAPVWALMARANVFGGSTGYYRYLLFDRFLETIGTWWLFGVIDIEGSLGLWDMCNQFVLEGVRGGLLRLGLFVLVISFAFQALGWALRAFQNDPLRSKLIWGFGAMLFSNFVTFWGYDYWDQIIVLWYFLLAVVASFNCFEVLKPELASVNSLSEVRQQEINHGVHPAFGY